MKRKLTSLFLVTATLLTNAQVMLQENFTSPFNAATAGWVRINNSTSPSGNWAQGNGAVFPAFNGSANDYYSANYQSSASSATNATISNWLITPTITLTNGGVLEFATRTTTNPTSVPDRLEVYMSQGVGTNVGNTTTSVGTFSTLLVTVNAALTTTGYPGAWTVYTATVTGLGAPTAGRIGFRYHVTNGGPNGANSNYIGLDAVRYHNPCGVVVPSYTICSGGSATLNAMYGAAPITYTWDNNSNNSSIVVNPASTTVYTLNYSENGQPCPQVTSTVTIGSQLSIGVAASASTVCPGSTVTFTATGAATNFTWLPSMAQGSVTTFTVNSASVYSVAALSGLCPGGATVQVNTYPQPTVSIAASHSLLCQGTASTQVTYTGNGASTYIWVLGSQTAQSPTIGLNIAAPNATTPATRQTTLGLVGFDANGCADTDVHTLTISLNPTVSVNSATLICKDAVVTLTANGAATYSWTNGATTNTTNYSNSVPGNYTITAVGTNTDGCSVTAAPVTVTVDACVGIQKMDVNTLNASFYPNPFSQQLRVSGFNGTVEVFNTTGQLVIRQVVNGAATIDTAELPKGVYIVQGYNNSGELTVTEKLIKH